MTTTKTENLQLEETYVREYHTQLSVIESHCFEKKNDNRICELSWIDIMFLFVLRVVRLRNFRIHNLER